MQKSRSKNENGTAPPGVRNGVWLAVSSLAVVCLLVVTSFPRRGAQLSNEIAPDAEVELRKGSLVRSEVGVSTSLQHTDSELGSRIGWWFPAPTNAEEAARFASAAANQRARELYDCEPFRHERPAQLVDGRWVWSDSRGQGRADLEATVEFAADGSMQSVDVLWLDSSPERP